MAHTRTHTQDAKNATAPEERWATRGIGVVAGAELRGRRSEGVPEGWGDSAGLADHGT